MDSRWLVVADDFTGAGDAAVRFGAPGRPARLILDAALSLPSGPGALAFNTDTRYSSAEAAYGACLSLFSKLSGRGRVFKKIDSTLRGNYDAEIGAALDSGAASWCLFASAAPRNGRTVRGGLCRVGGAVLGSGAFGDPGEAGVDADAARVLGRRFPGAVASLGLPVLRAGPAALSAEARRLRGAGARILVADAETAEDLALLADLASTGDCLPAGSSGLAEALAGLAGSTGIGPAAPLPAAPRAIAGGGLLFVVGSITPASREQGRLFLESGAAAELAVDAGAALADPGAERARLLASAAALDPGKAVLLRGAGGAEQGGRKEAAALAAFFGSVAAALVRRRAFRLVYASGGDTAAAAAAALGGLGIEYSGELAPGVPRGVLDRGPGAPGLGFASKSGGFGGPDTLNRIYDALTGAAGPQEDSMQRHPIVGITMGDAAGVGPEIVLKAFADGACAAAARCVVYGSPEVLRRAAPWVGWTGEILEVSGPAACAFRPGTVEVVRCGDLDLEANPVGRASAACGDLAFHSVRRAIADAMAGLLDATATAPLNKEALGLAGHRYAGHTEIYAHFTGAADYAMLLMEGNLRVVHVSTHVSLRRAVDLVKKDRIVAVARLVHRALSGMGIAAPRIALAGLNPHAGENGLFGREELDEIAPAAAECASLGVTGPYPPDTVFSRAAGGEFDAVVAMYHDQGHIPLKMAGFRYGGEGGPRVSGINVTLGTSVVRCSVDHGTAFDRAGTGSADASSMVAAVVAAAGMARADKPRP